MILIIFSLEYDHYLQKHTRVVLVPRIIHMSALYILILVSIFVAALFLAAFIWSVRSNQYEDIKGASMRMLHEDDSNLFI